MKHINWYIVYLVLGLWLFVSPYILGFTHMPGAYWNAIILGLLFVFSSACGLYYGNEELAGSQVSHQAHKA